MWLTEEHKEAPKEKLQIETCQKGRPGSATLERAGKRRSFSNLIRPGLAPVRSIVLILFLSCSQQGLPGAWDSGQPAQLRAQTGALAKGSVAPLSLGSQEYLAVLQGWPERALAPTRGAGISQL